jgi:hypothetical protein
MIPRMMGIFIRLIPCRYSLLSVDRRITGISLLDKLALSLTKGAF